MGKSVIIVPCYNEEKRLRRDAFLSFAENCNSIRFLFVDDGSRDKTAEVIGDVCDLIPSSFSLLRLEKNAGKAEAVRQGFLSVIDSGAEYVGFWDADLATPLEAIPEFVDIFSKKPELEMVFGSRVKLLGRTIERNPARHYIGRCFATVVSLILRLPVYDTQCGAKLFRVTPTLKTIFSDPFASRWIFDVEIIARFLRMRRGVAAEPPEKLIYELPLQVWENIKGSKIKLSDFPRVLLDLWRINSSISKPYKKNMQMAD